MRQNDATPIERPLRCPQSIAAASGNDKMSLALKVSEEITAPKAVEKFQANIEILESLVRDLLLVSRGLPEHITHADLKKQLSGLSQKIPAGALTKWIAEIESLKSDLRFNINKKVGTDALFVKMAGMT